MTRVIVYKQTENLLAICEPTGEVSLAKVIEKDIPQDSPYVVMNSDDLPKDIVFYNAWDLDLGVNGNKDKIVIDMPRAREIWKEVLREERKPYLASLDIDYQKALEKQNDEAMKKIAFTKQRLRDITKHPNINAAQTTEDLKLLTVASVL